MRYVIAAVKIFGVLFAFFGLVGLFGGLNSDFPQISSHPIMQFVNQACGWIIVSALDILWNHFDGALLFFVVTVVIAAHWSESSINKYRAEFDEKRRQRIKLSVKPKKRRPRK